MRIEKLLPPPQPGKPWSVALEGGEVLRVSESVVASFALYGGMELEAETLTALQEAAALAAWREKAGRLLTARMLSSGQLAEKLTAKGATEEQAAQVVAWAQDIGLLDDSAYAKALARHYTAKGYGPYKIKDEFYRRQVPREDWEEALAAVEEDPALGELAKSYEENAQAAQTYALLGVPEMTVLFAGLFLLGAHIKIHRTPAGKWEFLLEHPSMQGGRLEKIAQMLASLFRE